MRYSCRQFKNELERNKGKYFALPEGWEIIKVYNLSEAAKFLGVCDKTLRKLAESGAIPYRRVGRRWLFSDKSLRDWINASGKASAPLEVD